MEKKKSHYLFSYWYIFMWLWHLLYSKYFIIGKSAVMFNQWCNFEILQDLQFQEEEDAKFPKGMCNMSQKKILCDGRPILAKRPLTKSVLVTRKWVLCYVTHKQTERHGNSVNLWLPGLEGRVSENGQKHFCKALSSTSTFNHKMGHTLILS